LLAEVAESEGFTVTGCELWRERVATKIRHDIEGTLQRSSPRGNPLIAQQIIDEHESSRLHLAGALRKRNIFLRSGSAQEATRTFPPPAVSPDVWRKEHRIIDLHMHIDAKKERFTAPVRIMDAAGVGIGATSAAAPSARTGRKVGVRTVKEMADQLYPDRFRPLHEPRLRRVERPDFPERAMQQIEEGNGSEPPVSRNIKGSDFFFATRKGNSSRSMIPKLDGVWRKCGELGLPVSIHIADPRAFWLPYDERTSGGRS
jgi:predicted TIM-barrel fold metal-dependent hydrolase